MSSPLPGPGSDRFSFSERIHRYLSGIATAEECAQLQDELSDPAKRKEFLAASVLEGRLRQTADGAVAAEPAPASRPAWAGVGAALIAAAAVVMVLINGQAPELGPEPTPDSRVTDSPVLRTVSLQASGGTLGSWGIAAAGTRPTNDGIVIEQPADRPILAQFIQVVRTNPAQR